MRPIDADAILEKECCGRISGEDIRNAPTLDVAPVRHGRWIRCRIPKKYGGAWIECSQCSAHGNESMNYCPHCGAKMRGDDDASQD